MDGQSITVGGTSIKVLPNRGIENAIEFPESTTILQGTVIKNGTRYYWAINAGTTGTTAPEQTQGDDTIDGITWRLFSPRRRKKLILVNDSSDTIYLSCDIDAELNKGIRLNANGGAYTDPNAPDDVSQDAMYAISTGESSVLTYQE